ncbi:hypothetical protein VTN77DRAFT_2233 [Rasamsonia byssochlamydoides]|uniref:uncharacterized protein n=1 Tax=Rasamsonia byssochlamydoides TaxID=89139 RepID=UPI003743E9E0
MARPDLDDLHNLVQSHPIIDNHAHNLLSSTKASDYAKYPFESITSEAQGLALDEVQKTFPHHRAVTQLASLFECDTDWSSIKAAREQWVQKDYTGLVKKCLEGTHTLLLDDLLADVDVEPYPWHDQFTASKTKRIVRIEAVAARILKSLQESHDSQTDDPSTFHVFRDIFQQSIQRAIEDPEVAGFKSVVCYRTGLDVNVPASASANAYASAVGASFARTIQKGAPYRIADKPLNDWLVVFTLDLLREAKRFQKTSKPLQFHTGLGDSDIKLVLANPAYLQPLITAYPDIDFVLLHSSYPYTREAGYLAAVYPNVYLDLGEVFPMVSQDAEESIIRQSLEITPTSRLLWSTDGHFHPETFWLANKQFRDTLETVLIDYVKQGTLTVSQAKDAAADIMFNNSNRLYSLKLPPVTYTPAGSVAVSGRSPDLDALLRSNPDMIIWMQWVDYTATIRVRMFPIREFIKIVKNQRRVGNTLAVLHMLQDDLLAPGGTATGQFYLHPDLSSLCKNVALSSNSATVMNFWRDENGREMEGCPRTTLQKIVTKCEEDLGINLTFGFEIEVVFLKPVPNPEGLTDWVPLTRTHSWSNMTGEIRQYLPFLEDIVATLRSINIHIEQFHAESAPGQFEFILPPSSPLSAVDTLIKARQTISNVAEKHGFRATLYPRPYPYAAGTASHAHFSISPTMHEESFLAGILEHFPAIAAFSLSQDISYARVTQGVWAGGEWVTWGTQNRETPIRKISPGHWEMRSLDGLANMYFAVAAVVAAGFLGVSAKLPLTHRECLVDASSLTEEQRSELGITTPIPKTLAQSLAALESDTALQELLGPGFVKNYCSVKRAESEKLAAMEEEKRRRWLVERLIG